MSRPQAQNLSKFDTDKLVGSAGKGDTAAFERLYQEFFPKISRFVAFRVSHKETAEDLIAEIFIKAWETLQGEIQIVAFPNWLFTIARNKIIDHYRTKKSFADLFELENLIEYEDNVIAAIDLDIASKEFLSVLDRLSPDQQQIIRLKFLEGLENDEIAAITDKSAGTVRVVQHRAINALKKLLAKA